MQKIDLENAISSSGLLQSDKDFLVIHLYSCIIGNDTETITQDTLNKLCDRFIQTYPNHSRVDFLKTHIRFKYVPSNWGIGMEYASGYGLFTNQLKQHFSNNVPFGFAFDIGFKNVVLFLRNYIGVGHTLHDFTEHSEVWPKKSTYNYFLPEASLGYVIHDGKHIKLTPFVGIASSDIGPVEADLEEHPNLDEYDLEFTTTYTLGLSMDFKFGNANNFLLVGPMVKSNFFIRLRYTYCLPQFSDKYPGFEGNVHFITLGIGAFSRRQIRDK